MTKCHLGMKLEISFRWSNFEQNNRYTILKKIKNLSVPDHGELWPFELLEWGEQ